ncbi:MAG: hypothetical protein AB8G95_16360, partial [Anaerolineae bacterium]
MKNIQLLTISLTLLLLSACTFDRAEPVSRDDPNESLETAEVASTLLELSKAESLVWSQTNIRSDGNRFVSGNGNLPNIDPIDVELSGEPTWVVGLPFQDGALWVTTLAVGRVEAYSVIDGAVEEYPVSPSKIPAGMPPLVVLQDNNLHVVVPKGDFSSLTHPVLISGTNQLAYIDNQGGLVVETGEVVERLDINAQL